MCDGAAFPARRAVIKIGGSVLTGASAYRRVARLLADRVCERTDERILAIVSAENGVTDALLASARDIVSEPHPETLDLLWSTGELRSVALLVFALQALGIQAAAANVHQTGLVHAPEAAGDPPRSSGTNASTWRNSRLRPLRLRSLLASADVVVTPGFLARSGGDRVRSLGRGGSDLTAVLLASGLDAGTCELFKDVPGYFNADPHITPDATPLESLRYDTAIEMARQGCSLVQLQALEAARDLNVRLIVRGIEGGAGTVVSS
jgi:aspartate kinase